jgi:hypothetical protein
MAGDELTLAQLLTDLKEEIKSAQATSDKMFQLGDVMIKTKVRISSKRKGDGKISIYVATAELGKEKEDEYSHEVTLTLKPIEQKIYMGRRKK